MNYCEQCAYLTYDEELEDYLCGADMDEDDYARLMGQERAVCPFFRDGDEYKVVRHQM